MADRTQTLREAYAAALDPDTARRWRAMHEELNAKQAGTLGVVIALCRAARLALAHGGDYAGEYAAQYQRLKSALGCGRDAALAAVDRTSRFLARHGFGALGIDPNGSGATAAATHESIHRTWRELMAARRAAKGAAA